jgi:hypothetical protein
VVVSDAALKARIRAAAEAEERTFYARRTPPSVEDSAAEDSSPSQGSPSI